MTRVLSSLFFVLFFTACGGGSNDFTSDDTQTNIEQPEENNAPIANAGADQQVAVGAQVFLDASNSSDSDGDALSFSWTFEIMPDDSMAALDNNFQATPSFFADAVGEYTLSLIVNDGLQDSTSDSITITVVEETELTETTYAIVDTGQPLCFNSSSGNQESCSGKGYDADYAGNQPSYSLIQNGLIIHDNVTGLDWAQSSDTTGDSIVNYYDKMYQSDAVNYCSTLDLGGYSDWRLPNIKEAYSIIMFSGRDPSGYTGTDTSELTAFLNPIFDWAFGDLNNGDARIIDGQYATSTIYTSTTMNGDATMFGMNYVDGRIKGYPQYNKTYYVRCVRGNQDYGVNQFVDNGDQTISDQATALMWQKQDYQSSNWDDGVDYCEAATTAGHSDWRMPNVKELHSLLDYNKSPDQNNTAAISSIFESTSITNEGGETDWGAYWASTTHATFNDNGSNATYVSFGRALGYMQNTILDVHGAGAQRSNDKVSVAAEEGAQSATGATGTFYYKGPQGDILRDDNFVRCVRDMD